VQDDRVLLHGSDASVNAAINQIQSLGATYVRLTAGWSTLAPRSKAALVPGPPFSPGDASTYSHGPLHELDRAVVDASQAGLKVMIDVAFWAPRWAVPVGSPRGENRYSPDPALFGAFAQAVARRYEGRTPDPAEPSQMLPAVKLYTIWNEPNHAQFLQPQWRHAQGGWIAESPQIYRALYQSSYAAIKGVDGSDQVLIGATAPDGSTTPGRGNVPPLDFVRGLACVDRRMRPLRIPECKGYAPLQADGYAHHPYSLGNPPGLSSPLFGNVPLADMARLEGLLGALNAVGRITGDWPIYETEYGYQTNPPDPYAPTTLAAQAAYIGWSTFLAWRDPHTKMFAQFLLRDSEPDPAPPGSRAYWRSYQTGLNYENGDPKPAAEAFRLPFWVERVVGPGSPLVFMFGETRAAPPGRQLVEIQQLSPDGTRWLPVHTLNPSCSAQGQFFTDTGGYLETLAPFNGTPTFRLGWRRPDGTWEYGVPITVDDSSPFGAGPAQPQPGSVIAPRGLLTIGP
jgi:hypothetical protein